MSLKLNKICLLACVTVTFNAAGLLVGGLTISRLLPNAETVSLWKGIVTGVQIVVLILLTQFGCDSGDLVVSRDLGSTAFGQDIPIMIPTTEIIMTTTTLEPTTATQISNMVSQDPTANWSSSSSITEMTTTLPTTTLPYKRQIYLLSNCSSDCNCTLGPMTPLCDQTSGRMFYSPCHAGCEKFNYETGTYSDCSCISEGSNVTNGFCEGHGGCYSGLITTLVFTAISQFLGSTGVIGTMLIYYRFVGQIVIIKN